MVAKRQNFTSCVIRWRENCNNKVICVESLSDDQIFVKTDIAPDNNKRCRS